MDIKIKARFYADFDFSWTAQKEPMCEANCYITGSSWSFHFAERSSHCLRYIIEGMTEKLYRVLLDAGDMTSLQRALAILQRMECTGQKVPKQ